MCAPRWDPLALRSFVGVSGIYDLVAARDHMHELGLDRTLQDQLMSIHGKPAHGRLSPTHCALAVAAAGYSLAAAAPPVHLLHGSADRTVPCAGSHALAEALAVAGVRAAVQVYKGDTHTTPLLENPMRGGRDLLTDDILSLVFGERVERCYEQMCPDWMIRCATACCPF